MKHLKKNHLHLIGIIQSASYLLLATSIATPKSPVQRKQMKKMVNDTLAYLKRDMRKLKRV